MNKKWEIYQTNEEKVEKLQEKYKLNRLLSTLLTNRGITEEAEITKFLNPKRSDFYDPFGMPDSIFNTNISCRTSAADTMNKENEGLQNYGTYQNCRTADQFCCGGPRLQHHPHDTL